MQGTEDGKPDTGRFPRVDRAAPESLVQRLAPHQLHDDPRESVEHLGRVELVGALETQAFALLYRLDDHVVDGDGGGMVDPGGGAGLAVQPVRRPAMAVVLRVTRQPGLPDGDFAPHELVVRPPDGARPAGTDALDQPVPPADHPALDNACSAPVVTHDPSVPRKTGPCRSELPPGAVRERPSR